MTEEQQRLDAPHRWAWGALVFAGPLWAWFGVSEFLRPWGRPTRYDPDVAYDVVLDRSLYWISAGPGSAALGVTAGALVLMLRLRTPDESSPWALRLAASAWVLGVLSLVGVVVSFDPVATGGRVLGFTVLGAAAAPAARGARADGDQRSGTLLAASAVLTLLLLPLWPLVYAVQLVPAVGAALCFVAAGAAWIALGTTRPVRRQEPAASAVGSRNAAVS